MRDLGIARLRAIQLEKLQCIFRRLKYFHGRAVCIFQSPVVTPFSGS